MRVVIDTNTIFSAIFYGGKPEKILNAIFEDVIDIVLTEEIILEYETVIVRQINKNEEIPLREVAPLIGNSLKIIDRIKLRADIIEAHITKTPYCSDSDDIMFLQAAIAGKAKYLVSGDKHLLKVAKYKGGIVVEAKDFLERLGY